MVLAEELELIEVEVVVKPQEQQEEGDNMVQTKCEIYSRIVGYIRPVEQWHEGKQAEFSDRKKFGMSEKINNQTKILGGIKNE
jgi:hypothetical protein